MPLSRRALGSRRADNWRRLPPVGLELSSEQRKQRWGLIDAGRSEEPAQLHTPL